MYVYMYVYINELFTLLLKSLINIIVVSFPVRINSSLSAKAYINIKFSYVC